MRKGFFSLPRQFAALYAVGFVLSAMIVLAGCAGIAMQGDARQQSLAQAELVIGSSADAINRASRLLRLGVMTQDQAAVVNDMVLNVEAADRALAEAVQQDQPADVIDGRVILLQSALDALSAHLAQMMAPP